MEIEIYSVQEIAKLLGVVKRVVYELISTGKLRSVRIGRSIKITNEAINNYIGVIDAIKSKERLNLKKKLRA